MPFHKCSALQHLSVPQRLKCIRMGHSEISVCDVKYRDDNRCKVLLKLQWAVAGLCLPQQQTSQKYFLMYHPFLLTVLQAAITFFKLLSLLMTL